MKHVDCDRSGREARRISRFRSKGEPGRTVGRGVGVIRVEIWQATGKAVAVLMISRRTDGLGAKIFEFSAD